jgi:hypothetical protein
VGAAAVGIGLMTVALMLSPGGYDDVAPGRPPITSSTVSAVCFLAGAPLLVVGTLVIWGGSVLRLVRARPPERQQLAWLLVVIIPCVVLSFFAGSQSGFTALGFLIPVAIAVGVLRYRLLGIELVVRRGLVYGALTAAVIGVYLLVTTVAGPGWTGARCLEWSRQRWSRSGSHRCGTGCRPGWTGWSMGIGATPCGR